MAPGDTVEGCGWSAVDALSALSAKLIRYVTKTASRNPFVR